MIIFVLKKNNIPQMQRHFSATALKEKIIKFSYWNLVGTKNAGEESSYTDNRK